MSVGKKFLSMIYYTQKEIRRLRETSEVLRLSTLPGTILPTADRVQTSRRFDRLGDSVAASADIDDKIRVRMADLKHRKKIALDIITSLDNPAHRALLILRYLKITESCRRPSWDDIAAELGYTWRHTMRLHRDALEAFTRVYAQGGNDRA